MTSLCVHLAILSFPELILLGVLSEKLSQRLVLAVLLNDVLFCYLIVLIEFRIKTGWRLWKIALDLKQNTGHEMYRA